MKSHGNEIAFNCAIANFIFEREIQSIIFSAFLAVERFSYQHNLYAHFTVGRRFVVVTLSTTDSTVRADGVSMQRQRAMNLPAVSKLVFLAFAVDCDHPWLMHL